MALDQGHPVEVRARIRHVVDDAARPLGEIEHAGDGLRHLALDAASSAITLSILVPDGTDPSVLAARVSRHPTAIEAQGRRAVLTPSSRIVRDTLPREGLFPCRQTLRAPTLR